MQDFISLSFICSDRNPSGMTCGLRTLNKNLQYKVLSLLITTATVNRLKEVVVVAIDVTRCVCEVEIVDNGGEKVKERLNNLLILNLEYVGFASCSL